ncbi:MAG TPA: acyl-CoA dehydrogenase family protein, partial [Caulobacteraceae bacterium]
MGAASVTEQGREIAARVEAFVRGTVIPYERDPRCGAHGPADELVVELRDKARAAGVLTPHIPAGGHLSHQDVALVLRASGLSPLGPVAVNVAAPDEGNMYLLGKVASPEQKARFLAPMLEGRA